MAIEQYYQQRKEHQKFLRKQAQKAKFESPKPTTEYELTKYINESEVVL